MEGRREGAQKKEKEVAQVLFGDPSWQGVWGSGVRERARQESQGSNEARRPPLSPPPCPSSEAQPSRLPQQRGQWWVGCPACAPLRGLSPLSCRAPCFLEGIWRAHAPPLRLLTPASPSPPAPCLAGSVKAETMCGRHPVQCGSSDCLVTSTLMG